MAGEITLSERERKPADVVELPLFLLNTVLFPDGRLPLRVFERRYMDMVSRCLKSGRPFGVCLIQFGQEVGEAAVPHIVGTRAHMTNWDMAQTGILDIVVRGGQRFRVFQSHVQDDGLVTAVVELFPDIPLTPVPEKHRKLVELLRRIFADLGEDDYFPPADWSNADWVANRLAELAPISRVHKQNLLELPDPVTRLKRLTTLFHA